MKIANKYLEAIALTIQAFQIKDEQAFPVSGLLHEEISLGLKRKLQKIRTEVLAKLEELEKDKKEVGENVEEMKVLMEEEVEINQEYASLEMIENINTKFNYDFEVIEKFAK